MDALSKYFYELYLQSREPWALIGWIGQLVFTSRFIVQWIESEKQKKSVIPVSFWYLSIVGSILLTAYGFYVKQPVYIAGYLFNSIIYVRNLHLIHQGKKAAE